MEKSQFDIALSKVHKQKFLKKNALLWLQMARVVGDLHFARESESDNSKLPLDNWWKCCFDLLVPFQVKINHIHYLGHDDDPEYIELINEGPAIVDISGWKISAGNQNQQFIFPQASLLQPGKLIKVFTNNSDKLSFGFDKKQIWNNKGDTGKLMDNQGHEISAWSYGQHAHSYINIIDIEYDGAEFRTEADENVEILNTSSRWLDISNWTLNSNNNQSFTFPDRALIPPYSSIRVYTDQIHQESGGFSFESKSAIWNNNGDSAELKDASGKMVSKYVY